MKNYNKSSLKALGIMMIIFAVSYALVGTLALTGVVSATADHVAGSASVDLDSEVSDADFKKAIEEDAGYKLLGIE